MYQSRGEVSCPSWRSRRRYRRNPALFPGCTRSTCGGRDRREGKSCFVHNTGQSWPSWSWSRPRRVWRRWRGAWSTRPPFSGGRAGRPTPLRDGRCSPSLRPRGQVGDPAPQTRGRLQQMQRTQHPRIVYDKCKPVLKLWAIWFTLNCTASRVWRTQ